MPLTDLIRHFNSQNAPGGSSLFPEGERAAAWYRGLRLGSSFQPVFDRRRRVVAHEAFLMAVTEDGRGLAPPEVFALATDGEEVVRLDRLARTLHTLNFLVQRRHAGGYLHLNVHPRHLEAVPSQHGLIFEAVLKRCGLGPEDIGLELNDHALVGNHDRLLAAVTAYRQRGYHIALNCAARLPTAVEGSLPLHPDMVKLDIADGRGADAATLAREVAAIHAAGAVAIVQGIEDAAGLALAEAAGADLLQGFFLGRPRADCLPTHSGGGVA